MNIHNLPWATMYLMSEWAIRIGTLVYVPQKRSPAAARAWLLLIFFLPLPGLILYSMMGRIYLPRRRIALQRQASQVIRTVQAHMPVPEGASTIDLPEYLQQAVKLATRLGDFVALGGNEIELLPGYDVPLARLTADLDAATTSIHFLYYIFEDDEVGRRMADTLCAAAARGVRCRVLMDTVGSRRGLRNLAPRMRAAGIEVHAMLPVGLFRRNVGRFDLRNHRKIVVIDGRLVYSGSQNIVGAEFIRGCPNEELVMRVRGPVVPQFQGVFLADWFFETGERPIETGLLPSQDIEGAAVAQVLPSGPGYGRENTKDLMIALIYAARDEVTIATPYFVPDEPFLAALLSAARRGVLVRLILPKRSNQRITLLAQKSYYAQLMAAGIEIHLYERRFLHAKHMTIDDGVAMIGSTNMDIRSFALNAEVTLLAYDADVVGRLKDVNRTYCSSAQALDTARWSRRPLISRVVQNLARMADSLL